MIRFLLNNRVLIFFLLSISSFISCSKDNDEPEQTEITITASDFSSAMDENPTNGYVIGTVQGSTNQGTVTFSITEQNPAGAFSIDASSGELKVANESLFDFETNPIITGTVKVANGSIIKNALITITLNDVNEDNIFDGNVALRTQAEVDEFGTHNYIGITGHLIIGYNSDEDYSDITDLSSLEALTFVGKEVGISHNKVLKHLIGLGYLSEIGSHLTINNNPVLVTLESLNSLTVINKDLSVINNDSLTSFNGLHNIVSVGQYLTVMGMPVVNLNGLHNITSARSLVISYNPNLENIDALSGITTMAFLLLIEANPSLVSLDALQNTNSTIISMHILDNESILNLNGLTNIDVDEGIVISNNKSLTSLSGLESVTNLASGIQIEKNENLLNLNGLENLIEASLQFLAWQNPNLSDFCAIKNL